ncbi:MAG: lytic transglycosylase domain-containing protein [Myxococcaceae bacterium]
MTALKGHETRTVPLLRDARLQTAFALACSISFAAGGAPLASKGPLAAVCRSHAYEGEIRAAVLDVAAVWPLPVSFIKAVILRESGFRPSAVSASGAVGLMQVLPSNARRLGFAPEALWSPASNVLAGTRLLAVLLKHYGGDVISALVAYNASPRRKFAPLPQNAQTPAYVRSVLHAWAAFERCEGT